MVTSMTSLTRITAVYLYWTTTSMSTHIYESITQPMTCGGTKIQSTPVPIPMSCYCHKKMSAHILIGMLTSVLSFMPWYSIATTSHLRIPSQNGWTSYLCTGSDVIQISAPDGMQSDYPDFNSLTKKTYLTLSAS